jgi:hypothetical protein
MNTACLHSCPSEASSPAFPATAPFIDCGGTIALRAGEVFGIDPRAGMTVTSAHGDVWVTQSGDPRDVVLRGRRGFTPAPRGRVVLQALTAARVRVTTAAAWADV